MTRPILTDHARRQLDRRRIPLGAVEAALRWGRRYRSHGDEVFRLDRRCVEEARRNGVRIDAFEGVTVVLSEGAIARTVWRNRNPRRILR